MDSGLQVQLEEFGGSTGQSCMKTSVLLGVTRHKVAEKEGDPEIPGKGGLDFGERNMHGGCQVQLEVFGGSTRQELDEDKCTTGSDKE